MLLPSMVEAENFSDHPPYSFFSLSSTYIDHNLKIIERLYQRHVSPFLIKLPYIETSFVITAWRWFYQEAETCRCYNRLIISKLMIYVIEVDVRLKKLCTKSRMVTVQTDLSIGSEYLSQRISYFLGRNGHTVCWLCCKRCVMKWHLDFLFYRFLLHLQSLYLLSQILLPEWQAVSGSRL